MNAQTLNAMTKPELIVMAKNLGVRGLTATKKELVIEAILRKQNAPTIIINPVAPAPAPAPTLRAEAREFTPAPLPTPRPNMSHAERDQAEEDDGLRIFMPTVTRDFRSAFYSEPPSFDKMKLRHIFCTLKPSIYTPEYRLLEILFYIAPFCFVLNGGHTTPGGDEDPHYTLTVFSHHPVSRYRVLNHYHIHYERTQAGKELYTTITNGSRDVIADFRRPSSAASVVSDE